MALCCVTKSFVYVHRFTKSFPPSVDERGNNLLVSNAACSSLYHETNTVLRGLIAFFGTFFGTIWRKLDKWLTGQNDNLDAKRHIGHASFASGTPPCCLKWVPQWPVKWQGFVAAVIRLFVQKCPYPSSKPTSVPLASAKLLVLGRFIKLSAEIKHLCWFL